MLFNSYGFLFVFLPITWGLWHLACQRHAIRLALALLTVASLVFYSWWNPPYVLLILFSIIFNFYVGAWVTPTNDGQKPRQWFGRKLIFALGVFVNLALIGYFKYLNFFMENISPLMGYVWHTRAIFLPLGISFFTFQQIAWLVDSYRGLTSERRFMDYVLFVSFFPQLIAGPIVHHGQIIPQFQNKRTFFMNWRNISIGLALLSLGLFKKVVIADTLSPWVAKGFDNADTMTFIDAWAAALSYTFQIYFDFSGYSDMALGLGKLFNIDIPINFNSPYKATSIIEFWRRWHITLSQFLRDYLYVPIGGNRKGTARRYANLMLTMLLGGFWHGAAWTFVFWGGLHGVYLCMNHIWRQLSRRLNIAVPVVAGWFLTFISVMVAWVFFRAASFNRAMQILAGMAGLNGVYIPNHYVPVEALRCALETVGVKFAYADMSWHMSGLRQAIFLLILLVCVLSLRNSWEWVDLRFNKPTLWTVFVACTSFAVALGFLSRVSEFLYFQF